MSIVPGPSHWTTLSIGWTTVEPYSNPLFFAIQVHRVARRGAKAREIDTHYIPREVAITTTFPIRASFARASWCELLKLLDPSWRPRTSLTMWTAVEGMPQGNLDWLREEARRCKVTVFFDVDKGSKAEWWSKSRVACYIGASSH